MTDITSNIRELLFRHDCVILPAFGGFIGNYRPATIDASTGTFSPPVKAISFNRNLTHNDGLLIGKISEERKIGYADSRRIVEEYIDSVRRRLSAGERVVFDRIGQFTTNSEGSIEFEPDRDTNFLLDSYGFTSFKREPVAGHEIVRRAAGREPGQQVISRKMVWRAVAAVPFIAAMILVPLKTDLFSSRVSLNPLAAVGLKGDSAVTVKESLSGSLVNGEEIIAEPIASIEESGLPEADATMEAVTGDSVRRTDDMVVELGSPVVETASYHLVTGSFRNQDNALRMMREAGLKGYDAELARSDDGFYRVLLNSYLTRGDAENGRKELTAQYPGCWIIRK